MTVMVQAETPARILELIERAVPQGAESFGMQFCKLLPEYRRPEVYRELFAATHGLPVYATNYRAARNEGKSDEELGRELVELAECGAALCDVMADLYAPAADEFTSDPDAERRQVELINAIHKAGAKVLMSSHTHAESTPERILEIALGQQERGADVCKIVVKAETPERELDYLRLIPALREQLTIPVLFLCAGKACHLLRRTAGTVGNCMNLCVVEYDDLATAVQPLLSDMIALRELLE